MASTTTTMDTPQQLETLFTKIEEQKTILTNCADLYKSLTHHFTILQNSIAVKSQTLDSKFQTLNSSFEQTLVSLKQREDSIPGLLDSLSDTVECRKNVGLSEVLIPGLDENAPLSETLKSVCRRMNPRMLTKLLYGKRRQMSSLRGIMSEALSECVDDARFVVEAVKEFVDYKREKREGLPDKRLACAMVVGGMFPPDDLKEGTVRNGGLGRGFAKKAVERAEEVLREWKEVSETESGGVGEGGVGMGMGPSETAMFIEMALGFGLKEKFEDEFYKRMMVEFCDRRDMSKLAVPIFGDKIADFIEELVANGKEVEAVYFAFDSGLTERFQPVSLLKSFARKSRKNSTDILKNGHNTSKATNEANSMELSSINSIIKCVEEFQIEEQFPIESLKRRQSILMQAKAERKKGSTTTSTSNKRSHTGGARASGLPPPRPVKIQRLSTPRTKFSRNNHVSASKPSPVPRRVGPYTYPSQNMVGPTSVYTHAPIYGGYHIPAAAAAAPIGADQTAQQHYGVPGDNVASAGAEISSYYGSQPGYVSYNYGAAASAPSYPPPSHPQ
ncbi:hypothetical protein RND81_07G100800 [Saponaria officinalis]|uniref:FRIGIDA-like protein n=1 Tax=Saponaria officinalis TaxID=3572 RepID=A0AAW1JQ66_SAPOF